MNLEAELEREHSRQQADHLAAWIGGSARRFEELFHLFQNGRPLIRQRAGWAVSVVCETHPSLAVPHLTALLALGGKEGEHEAVARNIFKILGTIPLPEEHHGEIYDLALTKVTDPKVPAAVTAYAITVLRRMTDLYPVLREEVRLSLASLLPAAGAAVRSRLRKEFAM